MPDRILLQLNSTERDGTPDHPGPEPLVSVVVVNWNRRDLLRSCLESLARQQGPGFEVIVVDNGSNDGSTDVVREFAQQVPFLVQLIANKSNFGFCAANNQGIRIASGRYVALLNNDAEAEPGWLQAM